MVMMDDTDMGWGFGVLGFGLGIVWAGGLI